MELFFKPDGIALVGATANELKGGNRILKNLKTGSLVYKQFDLSVLVREEVSSGRGYGAGYAALGLMALLVALEGYRNGTRWAWMVMWVLVLAYASIAGIFLLAG